MPKTVKDCRKNCLSLYGECIENCKVQQPPGDASIQKRDNNDYHNRAMMLNCAGRCDNMKKKCSYDCENYRLFENEGAPEK